MRKLKAPWSIVLLLAAISFSTPLRAQQCSSPVNLASNASFDSGLASYTNSGSWAFNQTFSPSLYDTRAAVQNPAAAPAGNDAAGYPDASLNAFAINESDISVGTLSIVNPSGNFLTYFNGQLDIWFDMGWRQAGGASNPATLQVNVNGTQFLSITTIGGTSAGSATATLSNGASLGAGTPSTYFNPGGSGALSQWNTIRLTIPYSASTLPNVSWAITPNGSTSDDFAIDRIYVPMCQFAQSVVTNTNNSGMGSLRGAVEWANARLGPDTISFAIPGAGPHTITLASALPDITANGLTIDGTSQSGTQCRDLWAGSGHDLRINVRGAGFNGFRLGGTSQTIRGLSLTGFENAVFTLAGSGTSTIQCNYLGLLANGASSANSRGILVRGASARIGGLDAGQGNVISAKSIVGVVTEQGSTDTAIRGNFIGTDPAGMAARANGTGINNFFGSATWRDITRNLISGNNGNAGIMLETDDRVTASDGQVRIQRNIIGYSRDLSALLRNGGDGLGFREGSIANVLIGGDASTQGNAITGTDDAIDLRQLTNVTIQGNTIARALARGLSLNNVNGATIGGTSGTQGNIIGGNGTIGVNVDGGSSNITINGNQIGAATITGGTFLNQNQGILLNTANTVTIGNGSASGRNIISQNGGRAINGLGTNFNITINGNYVGTDTSGNTALTNGANVPGAVNDAISFDGGSSITNLSVLNNVIGGYTAAQVELWNSSGNNITIQGNSIGVGADGTSSIVSGTTQELIRIGGGGTYSNILIGGTGPGQGNLVANGGTSGVLIDTNGTNIQVIGNTIRNNTSNGIYVQATTSAAIVSNRIFANGQMGIDLVGDGVTANDSGDGDSGANDLLNFPAITAVNVIGTNEIAYSFTLDAPAAASGYRIEFFANSAADPSGHGEGEQYLGHIDITHAGGAQTYNGTLTTLEPVSIGGIISATTTRRTAGGAWDITSEFSAVAAAGGVPSLTVAMASEVFEPTTANPFATPGNDILLTTTVSNTGTGSTETDSLFAVISIDAANAFFNDVTPALGGIVGFQSGSPSLTFTPATDLRFSNSAAAPTSLAQCTYTPVAGYDPAVRHVCLNPKGSLPAGAPQGQFILQLRARIN